MRALAAGPLLLLLWRHRPFLGRGPGPTVWWAFEFDRWQVPVQSLPLPSFRRIGGVEPGPQGTRLTRRARAQRIRHGVTNTRQVVPVAGRRAQRARNIGENAPVLSCVTPGGMTRAACCRSPCWLVNVPSFSSQQEPGSTMSAASTAGLGIVACTTSVDRCPRCRASPPMRDRQQTRQVPGRTDRVS